MATILPGYGAPKATFFFWPRTIEEHGHEQRLAGQQTLARAHQGAQETAALLLRAVAEDGFHLDAVFHVHHAAGFGDRRFVWIQLDLDELHVVAKNLVVNLVHPRHPSVLSCGPRLVLGLMSHLTLGRASACLARSRTAILLATTNRRRGPWRCSGGRRSASG